ncbi:MAG: DUF4139 domain-containing protein [Kofleriaceae bacterium]|nr:DUF4139 domain-containing protein [Kofleriaceae bacterium]
MEAHLLSSKISAVTVYRSGARITRCAQLSTESRAGGILRVAGLPLSMDDSSVATRIVATKESSLIATDFRVVLDIPDSSELPDAVPEEILELRTRVRQLAAREKYLRGEVAFQLPLSGRPLPDGVELPLTSPLAARLAFLEFANAQHDSLVRELTETQNSLEDETESLRLLVANDRKKSSARAHRKGEVRKSVVLTTHGQGGASSVLEIDYFVPGACWAPSYSVRFSPDLLSADLAMRAMVAQRSGEDWGDIELTLSTADAQEWHELPELQSKRIGRKQSVSAKRAWKAPPTGAEELYRDYDGAFSELPPSSGQSPSEDRRRGGAKADLFGGAPQAPVPPPAMSMPMEEPMPVLAMIDESEMEDSLDDFDEEISTGVSGVSGAMAADMAFRSAPPMPAKAAAPMRARSLKSKKSAPVHHEEFKKEMVLGGSQAGGPVGGGGGGSESSIDIEVELLAYARLRMSSATSHSRGSLTLKSQSAIYSESIVGSSFVKNTIVSLVQEQVVQTRNIAEVPTGHTLPWSTDYDYAFAAKSRVDLASDGEFHNVPILEGDTTSSPMYVVVPRESSDVFRTVELVNPFAAPLLVGPIDVYWDDAYLLTSNVDFTVPKGKLSLGLGVDQDISVSRNTHYREDSVGLMGGSLALNHKIVIEVVNSSNHTIELEVRERIPNAASEEDDIKVELKSVQPPWLGWEPRSEEAGSSLLEGGHRWQIKIDAGQKETLSACYEVKLPSKYEIRGGNRREW